MTTATNNPTDPDMAAAERRATDAEGSTCEIAQAIDEANMALGQCGCRSVNGYGVYADPSRILQSLASAAKAIDQAIETHRNTKWPTKADYEALDG